MSDFDADTQDYLNQLAAKGPAQQPATLGEVWNANWGAAAQHTVGYADSARNEAMDQLTSAYATSVGRSLDEDARSQGIDLTGADRDTRAGVARSLSAGLPDDTRKQLAPFLDVDGSARRIAAKTERDAADVGARTWGLTGTSTAFMAGLARTMVDPVNLGATVALGPLAPEGVGLAAFAAREFAVNAGLTAIQHPFVSMGRESVGLAPTPFVSDVLEAGVGGVALGGVLRAGGWALKRALGGRGAPADAQGAPGAADGVRVTDTASASFQERTPPIEAQTALGRLEPEDFDAAARHAEMRAELDAGALAQTPEGRAAHAAFVADAQRAMDAGEGMSAWHGSPHAFDEFSMSAVGTGEGAQAFGHGLYFAENPGVAMHYSRVLGGRDGHLYGVNIEAEPHELLDWDRPLSGQSPAVKAAIGAIAGRSADDADFNAAFSTAGQWLKSGERERGAAAMAGDLRDAGVAGVHYLDAMSRGRGEGTRNFVIFDDKRVKLVARDGLIAPSIRDAPVDPVAALSDMPLPGDRGFTTAKGSRYVLHEDGTTTRDKAARADPGHEGDSGVKPRTERTVYVDNADAAASLSAAGLSNLGDQGARLAIQDGRASLLTWNQAAKKWGVSPSSRDIVVHDEPAVGRSPVEMWGRSDDVPGAEAYARQHAGNPITEMRGRAKESSQIVPRETLSLKAADPAGQALLADAQRVLGELGDIDLHVTGEDGVARVMKASDLLRDAGDDVAAAHEFAACIVGAGGAAAAAGAAL